MAPGTMRMVNLPNRHRIHLLVTYFHRSFLINQVYALPDFMVRKIYTVTLVLLSTWASCFSLAGCENKYRNRTHAEISSSAIEKGEILAHQYCQSCHLFPDPSLLDAKHWETGVLPYMGPRLGIFRFNFDNYPSLRNDYYLPKGFYPSAPLLKPAEWGELMDYYIATSPDSLPGQQRDQPIQQDLTLFTPISPAVSYGTPTTCYIKMDSSLPTGNSILLADVFKKKLFRFDKNLALVDSVSTRGPVVDVDYCQHHMLACNIGVLNPNNGKFGAGQGISLSPTGKMIADSLPLFDSLQRPVQILPVDINQDGRMDYLVCEFGFLTGSLSWMENTGDGKYKRHIIRAVPGAIKAYIQDYNHDGLPDIWVLFAQGDEGIFLFTNKGNGQFSSEAVLRFPPIYGSSYFEMDDFNGDGYPDILYTCGDNADYSTVLKPYHGVYIFLNDGKNHFTQKYFYPLNGCYKAMARDFDGDGDLDIAVISFFADYARQPEEGFIYLENKGNLHFLPHTLPAGRNGRWLTMDAADFDGDGKIDILLGNFSVAPGKLKSTIDWKKEPPFLLLKNTGNPQASQTIR